jgi:hypothetical protein
MHWFPRLPCLFAIASLSNHFKITFMLEELSKALPYYYMVIRRQNSDPAIVPSSYPF